MCDTWSDASEMAPLLGDVVNCKKAAIVTVFFTYIMYVVFTGMIHLIEFKWPEEKRELAMKLKAFKLDIEQKQFFILVIALLTQIQTPTAFPVVMLYLYLFTYPVLLVGHLKQDKKIIRVIALGVQFGFQLILIFFVLINPWCRYYYFRYIVGSPPDSYYATTQSQPQQTTTLQRVYATTTPAPTQAPIDNSQNYQYDNSTDQGQLFTTTTKAKLSWLTLALLMGLMLTQDLVRAQDSQIGDTAVSTEQATSAPPQDEGNTTTQDTFLGPPKIHLDEIEPEAGPTGGETRVLVRGGPFESYKLLYPKPMCKFGHDDMVVEATYVLCTSHKHSIDEKEAHHRDMETTCLQCDNSPASNKAEIISFTVSLTGDFSDVTNSLPYRYYPPSRIYAIYPRYGPKDGDTVVQVWGENFLNFDQSTRCAFGTKSVVATFINSNYMICVSPFSDVVEKPIPFTVSLNNQQNSRDSIFFWYYSWPSINELVPDRGPDAGGTKVLVKGRNFFPFKDETIDNANDTFCMFENLAKVPVQIINSTKVICISPPSYVLRQAIVEITLNNQQYTDDNNIFYYFRPPYLFDIQPRQGPVQGGTKVVMVGSNFRETKNITCKFNETVVPGKYLSTSEVECVSPPTDHAGFVPLSISMEMDMYSQPVQYLYYDQPVISGIEPKCGPDYGYTQITVFGKNFIDMGHNMALCVFNKTIFTNATVMDGYTLKCDSPSLLNGLGYSLMSEDMLFYMLEVSIDGGRVIAGPPQKFMYYKDPWLQSIVPDSGPTRGGTLVKIIGYHYNQEGACNKTMRFATYEMKSFNETNDTIAYVISPPVPIPDAVVVAVALNGQQFTRDVILHVKDPENTFEYYQDPLISSIHPVSGPSIGGTKINIHGLGFTPRKDLDGNPDKKRNRMWYRLVDPETGNIITESKEIAKEDLSDDLFSYISPPQQPNTKVLLQISLNDQDWQSVPQPKQTYTFFYYESPHITALHPTFGPVKAKNDQYMDIEGTGFQCPDPECKDLWVRFGDKAQGKGIFMKGTWTNSTFIRCKIPKYTKPDVLLVELTLNNKDYTNDGKTYGYYDPYVLNAEPRLISVDGSTLVRIKGFGFVNSSETKSLYSGVNNQNLVCNGQQCIKNAEFIDKNTLLTNTFPQNVMNYKDTSANILWDPINIDASVYGNDFTDSSVELYYYEDPQYVGLSTDESPANVENQIFVQTDFKKNPIDRLLKYSNFTCRFLSSDGRVMYSKGQMERYPLEPGNPNSIQCKSPKWDLKGKDFDKVKLDIAVNGIDFKGGFDFYFSQTLKIHRIFPMAGPTKSQSAIRLIGTGFKPARSNVTAKWGILETNLIVKYEVVDYIYQRLQFENMIEGVEGVKSYFHEATMFARVDTEMFEMQSYHAVYMQYPNLTNWTKTQGGPFYVEVGKNIEIKYHSKVNVTINTTIIAPSSQQQQQSQSSQPGARLLQGTDPTQTTTIDPTTNTPTNSTIDTSLTFAGPTPDNSSAAAPPNVTSPPEPTYITVSTYEEHDVIKSWIYYDYEPSSVEFYYYKECVVKDMQPHSGIVTGGTLVSVTGAWFKYMPEYGVVPHCKFGTRIVRALFDSTVRIVCPAPPSPEGVELGTLFSFEISMNGVDWSNTGFKFFYYETPSLDYINPTLGPEAGGTMIHIYGNNFTNMSNPSEFNCKFTAVHLPIPPKKMPGIYLNSTTIMCASPGGWGQGDAVRLQVTFNGGDYVDNNFTFTFFSISRAMPRSGPADGNGGDIIVEGFGFKNESGALCKINNTEYEPTSVTWNQIRCPMPRALGGPNYFGNVPFSVSPNGKDWHNFVGGFQFYPQPIVEDIFPKQGPNVGLGIINFYGDNFRDDFNLVDLTCKIGDSIGKAVVISPRHIKCVIEDMELVNEGEYLPAQVSLNRYSWTVYTNQTMFLPYGVEQIYPNSGPSTGVTDVIIQGKGFVDDEGNTARCRFGTPANYAIVDAQIISYERMVCKAPDSFKLIPPAAFPEDVPISIAITSDEYDPWTETSHKFRLYDDPVVVRSEPTEVEVGTMSEVLVWADENSQFFEPVPASKPEESESGLTNIGSGLGGITCQFGRFGETQAIFINETVIKCVTPSIDDDPDSIYREIVKLTVAMNGQDHNEDNSQIEFTFVGTGTYLVFWPFIIGALLIGLLIVALVVCCATIFQKMSMDDMIAGKRFVGTEGLPHVFNMGSGVMVPRGRADWNAERSSVDMLERASGQHY